MKYLTQLVRILVLGLTFVDLTFKIGNKVKFQKFENSKIFHNFFQIDLEKNLKI